MYCKTHDRNYDPFFGCVKCIQDSLGMEHVEPMFSDEMPDDETDDELDEEDDD